MGATLALKGGKRGASALLGYVNRHGKLDSDRIYTHEISPSNELAQKQLEATRRIWGKTGGVQAFHWVQSFDKSFDKENPEHVKKAHFIGSKLVDEISQAYPNHEIYMGTHTDSESGYIHNHIVFSSVNYQTGGKFHSNNEVGYRLQDLNDKVLADFGIQQPKEKYKDVDFEMHREGKRSNREEMKLMIIQAKKQANDFDSFKDVLEKDYQVEVYEFNNGKRIGFKWTDKEGKDFTIGGRKLGSDFERPGIEQSLSQSKEVAKEKVTSEPVEEKEVEGTSDTFSLSGLHAVNKQIRQEKEEKERIEKEQLERQKRQQKEQSNNVQRSGWDFEM